MRIGRPLEGKTEALDERTNERTALNSPKITPLEQRPVAATPPQQLGSNWIKRASTSHWRACTVLQSAVAFYCFPLRETNQRARRSSEATTVPAPETTSPPSPSSSSLLKYLALTVRASEVIARSRNRFTRPAGADPFHCCLCNGEQTTQDGTPRREYQ